jgi:hypothetical protein
MTGHVGNDAVAAIRQQAGFTWIPDDAVRCHPKKENGRVRGAPFHEAFNGEEESANSGKLSPAEQ